MEAPRAVTPSAVSGMVPELLPWMVSPLLLEASSACGDVGGASESDRLNVMSEAPRRFPGGAWRDWSQGCSVGRCLWRVVVVGVFSVAVRDGVLGWCRSVFCGRVVGLRGRAERVVQRAEAGPRSDASSCSFDSQCHTLVAFREESPSSRIQRVFDALHGHALACNSHTHNSPACALHGLHSVGEGVARGRGV